MRVDPQPPPSLPGDRLHPTVVSVPPRPASKTPRRRTPRQRVVVQRVRRRLRPPSRRRLVVSLAVGLLVSFAALYGGSQVALAFLDTAFGRPPTAHPFNADSMLLDRQGRLIADMHPPGETRIPVPLSAVAGTMQQGIVAVEDRNFWHEGAIDPARVVAAAWNNVSHRAPLQGASTITEQLAKVLYLDGSRSIDRKLREFFIARRLETTMSKQQILEAYLNDIYYGHGATGVEAAARTYFGISASHLDLAQAALLASLPNQPANLDPFNNLDAAQVRQRQVLQAMVDVGDITLPQAAAAAAEPIHLASGHADDINAYPILSRRIAGEVQSRLHLDPYRDGLRIVTTADSTVQDMAQRIISAQVDGLGGHHVTDGAMVAVDPRDGGIVAYVGSAGPGHPASQVDMAAAPRQPGSTFKLFTYSTAFAEKKITMLTPVTDAPLRFPTGGGPSGTQPYEVHNYDMRYHGRMPIAEALGNSFNIPAVKVELLAGIPNIVATARKMGVTTLTQPPSSYGYALTLGSYAVPLWEMAQAGSIFGAQGVLHPAHLLSSVKDASGTELLPRLKNDGQKALDPGVAFLINAILTNDANRVMSFGPRSALTLPDHVVAAKTGTTQDFRDNFTVGWTPHLAMAAWVGNADNTPMLGTTGITGAAPAWHDAMEQALRGVPDDWQQPPPNVHPGSMGDRQGWFLEGTGPSSGSVPAPPGTSDVHQQGDCRYWTYNGATFWWCGSGDSGLPGDSGAQGGAPGLPPSLLPPNQNGNQND